MKLKICDPSHEIKVMKNVRYYVATSEELEDTTTQTLDNQRIDSMINQGRTDQKTH
jgi:hypothetical protein